jgi:hypothetical protein
VCTPSDGPVLAIDDLFLGDTDFQHMLSAQAWAAFGFDLDDMVTTTDFTGHCLPNSGSSPAAMNDGNAGIDNSWGKNLLPLFIGLNATFSQDVNQSIDDGEFTLMLLFEQLSGPDVDPLTTKLYGGAPLGLAPAWDGNDCWPVLQEGLTDPTDIGSSTAVFPKSSVTADLWQSESTVSIVLPFTISGFTFPVTVDHVRMQAQLSSAHDGATLGLLGGVIDTEQLVEVVRDVAGSFDSSLCSGATFDSIANQIRQSSDILKNGTQDPTMVCDGISIGLGFTMQAVELGVIAPPQVPPADPCP